MRLIFLLVAFTVSQVSSAQDLTGIWRGSFNSSDNNLYSSLNIYDRYKFEVQIDDNLNKTFTGVTYSYKNTIFYGKASINGTINPKTGKVMLQEIKIIEVKMERGSAACIMTCFLQYTKNGDEEFLEGKYSSYNENDSSFCGKGTVFLRKVMTTDFYKEPFLVKRETERRKPHVTAPPIKIPVTPKTNAGITKETTATPKTKTSIAKSTPATKKVNPPTTKPTNPIVTKTKNSTVAKTTNPTAAKTTDKSVNKNNKVTVPEEKASPKVAKVEGNTNPSNTVKTPDRIEMPKPLITRTNEVVKTLTVNTNEVTINVYDNGTIDHDTVSIFLDKKLIVSKQMLTTSPIKVKLNFDEINDYHELIMVADNLGDIPPNTSLMVVKAGSKEYEVRITSTEQKNAVIIFKYEK